MDGALRNAVWNVIARYLLLGTTKSEFDYQVSAETRALLRRLWDEFYHQPEDIIPTWMPDA